MKIETFLKAQKLFTHLERLEYKLEKATEVQDYLFDKTSSLGIERDIPENGRVTIESGGKSVTIGIKHHLIVGIVEDRIKEIEVAMAEKRKEIEDM